jgi:excisionase family DNA binding protein
VSHIVAIFQTFHSQNKAISIKNTKSLCFNLPILYICANRSNMIEARIDRIEKENAALRAAIQNLSKKLDNIQVSGNRPMSVSEAAKFMGMSYHTLYRKLSEGVFPIGSKPNGTRWSFTRSECERYLRGEFSNPSPQKQADEFLKKK